MEANRYSFFLPTRIEVGSGIARTVGAEAKALGAGKVLLVADQGVIRAGLTRQVEASLREAGIPFVLFDRVVPNPRDYDCEAGYLFAKENGVDSLVSVGGGSSMDTAKAIGVLMTHGKTFRDWYGSNKLERDILPHIAIPTTAGTGSEVTPFAVITDSETKVKCNIFDNRAAPKVALCDPDMVLGLPAKIMASCGIDAMTHAVEAYTCTLASPFTDACALQAIRLIIANLQDAVEHPNPSCCAGMMLGSTLAGIAFGYADVAGVHCMAEALGGRYDMPHGVANAMLLPIVTEYNISANPQKYADISAALGVNIAGLSTEEAAKESVRVLRQLCADVKIPRMHDMPQVNPADFEELSVAAEGNVSTPSNPRAITRKEYLALYKKAYAD